MRGYFICIVAFILFSCSSFNKRNIAINREYKLLDSLVTYDVLNVNSYIDSVLKKDPKELYLDTMVYKLYRFMEDRVLMRPIENISTADTLYNYFKYKRTQSNANELNFGRISLYTAITYREHLVRDSAIYVMLKDAHSILSELPSPNIFKAHLFSFEAEINDDYKNIEGADKYYDLALAELENLNDTLRYSLVALRKAWAKISDRRIAATEQVLQSLKEKGYINNIDVRNYYYLLNTARLSLLYKRDSADFYFNKYLSTCDSIMGYFPKYKKDYLISLYYSYKGFFKESEFYALRAIDGVSNNKKVARDIYIYFRNLGDTYSREKMFYSAMQAYRKAYAFSVNANLMFNRKRRIEMERESLLYQKEMAEREEFALRMIILFSLVGVALIMGLVISLLLFKVRINSITMKNKELEKGVLLQELNQSKSMIDIISITLGILPKFVDRINELSGKLFSLSPTLYEEFQKEISTAKGESRKRLLDILSNERIIETNPFLGKLDSLSNQEKMILLLLKQDYPTKYIAEVLNITQSSVRGSKVKIKNKIKALDLDDKEKESILAILV